MPQDEIVTYAADEEVDVMGTHGRAGVNRLLLGSVTENVIRQTEIPVHVVRIGDPDE